MHNTQKRNKADSIGNWMKKIPLEDHQLQKIVRLFLSMIGFGIFTAGLHSLFFYVPSNTGILSILLILSKGILLGTTFSIFLLSVNVLYKLRSIGK